MQRVLVLGSSGMLGHVTLLALERKGYEVYGVSAPHSFGLKSQVLDLTDIAAVNVFFETHSFDVIVNCVALLVAESALHKDRAIYLNSYIPHYLERRFEGTRTKIIQVSTDGVFEGDKAPYLEDAVSDVRNFYGRTKFLGELDNGKDLTVRSAYWGPDCNSQSGSLLNWLLLQEGNIQGYSNHIFNGVSSLEFARFVDLAISEDITGLYHLISSSPISKYDFLKLAKKEFELPYELTSVCADAVSRVLEDTRASGYQAICYEKMLSSVRCWIKDNSNLYPQYFRATTCI